MKFVVYIVIGLVLSFLFVLLNKIIDKYKDSSWISWINWMKVGDEDGLAFACFVIALIWPLLLSFIVIGIGAAIIGLMFYALGIGAYKVFSWICNKILNN